MEDEECEYFLPLSDTIHLSIFQSMDLETLLVARLVCFSWNDMISSNVLPYRANLQVQVEKSKICKKFRKGEWSENIMGAWQEITVYFPEDPLTFKNPNVFGWGLKSSFIPFSQVHKVTLFDCGKAAFLTFVHSLLAGLPNIRQMNIQSQHWPSHALLIDQLTLGYHTTESSWSDGMKNAAKLTSLQIAVFQKRTTIKYMNFFNVISTPLSLITLDIDLSKNYTLPFDSMIIDEIYQALLQLINNCAETLKNFRIKWDHRVEKDLQLVQYSGEFDPYLQFLLMISSNLELFHKLHLKRLALSFPVISFTPLNLINEILVPFLKSQSSTMEKVIISRVRWDSSVKIFLNNFSPKYADKFELGVFMLDADTWLSTGSKLLKGVSKVEFHAVGSGVFGLGSINVRKVKCRGSGSLKWKKHLMTSLRFRNSPMNPSLEMIKIKEIVHNFRLLQDLELIDNSDHRKMQSHSNHELNSIFATLANLKSLKITNLERITDSGLTSLSEKEVCRRKDIGVFSPVSSLYAIPIAHAKNLMYLELRDLTSAVTDMSVYLAFQFAPKLEKVAFYGQHKITNWGRSVLLRKFKRNPRFELVIQPSRDSQLSYLLDFP